jgi:outer membrane assembly lipoprotein YfiO
MPGMRFGLGFAAIFLLLAGTASLAQNPTTAPTAEFRNGHWQPVASAPTTTAPAPDPALDQAQQLLNAKDPAAAETVALYWIKTHTNKAPGRDRALFLTAQAKFGVDSGSDKLLAFYYCDELLDEYPASSLFGAALRFQFKIADGYLSGKNDSFLGLPIVGRTDEAIQMLYRIQLRTPGSPLAERCLLRTADFYYAEGEYGLAHDAYGFYVKAFPRAKMVPQARFRQACASLAQFRGVRFDATNLLNARAELIGFSTAYPELAATKNVNGIVVRIDQALARKLFITADFYRRTHDYHGAVYMYRYLIMSYPNAIDIPEARQALAGMPKATLADPQPVPGADYSPPVDPLEPGGGK